ncbi:helix-turn-helix domain-containing protein [Antribacter sp. KLBMP9083]|uniref:Helix-turn-helix domain-containing protein n=1 Tax=Antribacter soli TaxID=2910976 RepID=A0AA41QBH4_9MICO|nr:helix-turn-helix transcriptional regulator [Antribacter soli]MCF4120071.1 helix-turn-helix domain-containing protein [Antribacter soli]
MKQHWYRARGLAAIGAAVRGARESTGLTQNQMAEHIGSSRPTISRLERGVVVSTDVLAGALAEAGYELYVVPRGARVTVELPREE